MDLAEWLLAQYDVDEKLARNCWGDDQAGWWHCTGDVVVADDDGAEVCETVMSDEAVHIARWDPAAVVADLNMKRRIIKAWQQAESAADSGEPREWGFAEGLERAVQLLALPYAKREGYQESWRPE